MKRILIITSCTGEKAVESDEQLTLDDFRQGGVHLKAREKSLAKLQMPAAELYTGQQHVVSMFLRNIPDGQYNRMAQSLEHGMMRLTYKPDQAARLMAVLKP